MNIVMVGIDHHRADITIREQFTFTENNLKDKYTILKDFPQILGSVILSTCNRCEIYFSLEENTDFEPFSTLCNVIGVDYNSFSTYSIVRKGEEVFTHLSLLGAGAKSKIWGEDQIISQIKTALITAREYKSADSYLEVLFRMAITCAKEIKTQIKFNKAGSSVAHQVSQRIDSSTSKNVLVIGNGEVGRLVAELLIKDGYNVTMTLRQYKYKSNIVPNGCNAIEYENRYDFISSMDVVVSATLSPHHTIEIEKIKKLSHIPKYFFDLAVPRDIDPSIAELNNTIYYNIDSMGDYLKDRSTEILAMEKIIEKHREKLCNWCEYKERVLI